MHGAHRRSTAAATLLQRHESCPHLHHTLCRLAGSSIQKLSQYWQASLGMHSRVQPAHTCSCAPAALPGGRWKGLFSMMHFSCSDCATETQCPTHANDHLLPPDAQRPSSCFCFNCSDALPALLSECCVQLMVSPCPGHPCGCRLTGPAASSPAQALLAALLSEWRHST